MDINTMKANLQMVGSRIIELNIKNDFVYLDINSENIKKEIDITYNMGDAYYLEEGVLARNLVLDIDLKISDILEEETLELCVGLKLEGCFSINEGAEQEMENLVEVNGTAALYSLARGIVSSITSQTCVNGTVLLPMINTLKMSEELE